MKLKKDDMFHFGNKCIIGGISTDCVCTVNGRTFFWGKNTYGLFEYRDGKCKYILREKSDEISEIMGYSSCCAFDHYIVFAPYNCSSICIFDYENNKAEYIPIGRRGIFGYGMCVYKNKIFFFGDDNKHLILDMHDRTVKYNRVLSGVKIRSIVCQNGRFAYAALEEAGHYLKMDLSDMSIQIQKAGDKKIIEICCYEDNLWLMLYEGSIIKLNIKSNESSYLKIPDDIYDRSEITDGSAMGTMSRVGDYIYCTPLRKDSFIRINIKTDLVEIICKIDGSIYPIRMFFIDDDHLACIMISQTTYNVYGGLVFGLDGSVEERPIFILDDEIDYTPGMNESACSTLKKYIRNITKSK